MVALAGIGLAAGAWVLRRAPPPGIHFGRTSRITAEPGLEVHPSLSPDGKLVAYAAGPSGQMRIYVRQLVGGRTIPVTQGVAGDQHWPRWSPDGTRLSFETGGAVYVVPALGGTPKLLVNPDGCAGRRGTRVRGVVAGRPADRVRRRSATSTCGQ